MVDRSKEVKEILKRGYSWCFIPAIGLGEVGFTAYIREFPGCITEGDTLGEAYRNLKEAATNWVSTVLYQGMKVPKPKENFWPRIRRHLTQRTNNGPSRKQKDGRTATRAAKSRTSAAGTRAARSRHWTNTAH